MSRSAFLRNTECLVRRAGLARPAWASQPVSQPLPTGPVAEDTGYIAKLQEFIGKWASRSTTIHLADIIDPVAYRVRTLHPPRKLPRPPGYLLGRIRVTDGLHPHR